MRKWHILCFQKSVKRGVEMSPKTDTEVIIGGKVFTLSGYESEDYMQNLAERLNLDMNELMSSSNSVSITTLSLIHI